MPNRLLLVRGLNVLLLESRLVDISGKGPQVAVGQGEADLRSNGLLGEAIPDHAADLRQADFERRRICFERAEAEGLVGRLVEAPVVSRQGQRAVGAASKQ